MNRTLASQTLRSLARAPLFSLGVMFSLGIGVGICGSVFGLVRSLRHAPVAFDNPERLFEVWKTPSLSSLEPSDYLTPSDVSRWRLDDLPSVDELVWQGLPVATLMEIDDVAFRSQVRVASPRWFEVTGLHPSQGRALLASDADPGAERAAVISMRMWRERFGGHRDVLGRSFRLSRVSFTVVGVLPPEATSEAIVWIPAGTIPGSTTPAAEVVALLHQGAAPSAAQAELRTLAVSDSPRTGRNPGSPGLVLLPIGTMARSAGAEGLWLVGGVAGVGFAMMLTNLATFFIVRAARRSQMVATRVALGAGKWQLSTELLAEGLILACGGTVLAVLVAHWGVTGLASLVGADGGGFIGVGLDWQIVPFVAAVSGLSAVLLSIEPLRITSSVTLRQHLYGGTFAQGPRGVRARELVVGGQVAMTVVLAAATSYLVGLWVEYQDIDVGYDSSRIVVGLLDFELAGFTDAMQRDLVQAAVPRLASQPSLEAAAAWMGVMHDEYPPSPLHAARVEARSEPLPLQLMSSYYAVTPEFFSVLGVEIVSGRGFTQSDGAASFPVAIVNRGAAELWWPGETPVGKGIKLGDAAPWMTVVGVSDAVWPVTQGGLDLARVVNGRRPWPLLFVPLAQATTLPTGWRDTGCSQCEGLTIAVRAAGDSEAAAATLRQELAGLAPDVPLREVATLRARQLGWVGGSEMRLHGRLVLAAASAALLLAILGIFGLVADGITHRKREIGVRLALGARSGQIVWAMTRQSAGSSVAGILVGGAMVIALARPLRDVLDPWSMLPAVGVLPSNPAVLALAAAVVGLVATLSAWLSASRVTRIEPSFALRCDQ